LPTHRQPRLRLLTIATLALAAVALALLMFGAFGGGYTVSLKLVNASQLVKGNRVKVGGVPVGSVQSIELDPDRRARIKISVDDDDLTPLHQGTSAQVRTPALVGIANRYIALAPGPNSAPKIPDGGEISADRAKPSIDLDQIVNAFDAPAQRHLRTLVRKGGDIFGKGSARYLNAGLHALNPALSQTDAVLGQVVREEPAFERLVVEGAGISSAVASRPADLEQLTSNTVGGLSAIAARTDALDSALVQLPPTLRRTNTTLVELRSLLRDTRPVVREARPVAPLLATVLERLGPVARRARPAVGRLRRTVRRRGPRNDLLDVLRELPPTAATAVPAFRSADRTVRDLLPVTADLRPYTPDFVGALQNGFGGTTGGYYDANGHYTRISFEGSAYTLNDVGTLVPLPEVNALAGTRNHLLHRCPGAATQTLQDRSNPYLDRSGFPCKTEENPR
jgi:phospholipid/cholesterol/gamma-HCH transport system substrate-binding protein